MDRYNDFNRQAAVDHCCQVDGILYADMHMKAHNVLSNFHLTAPPTPCQRRQRKSSPNRGIYNGVVMGQLEMCLMHTVFNSMTNQFRALFG